MEMTSEQWYDLRVQIIHYLFDTRPYQWTVSRQQDSWHISCPDYASKPVGVLWNVAREISALVFRHAKRDTDYEVRSNEIVITIIRNDY